MQENMSLSAIVRTFLSTFEDAELRDPNGTARDACSAGALECAVLFSRIAEGTSLQRATDVAWAELSSRLLSSGAVSHCPAGPSAGSLAVSTEGKQACARAMSASPCFADEDVRRATISSVSGTSSFADPEREPKKNIADTVTSMLRIADGRPDEHKPFPAEKLPIRLFDVAGSRPRSATDLGKLWVRTMACAMAEIPTGTRASELTLRACSALALVQTRLLPGGSDEERGKANGLAKAFRDAADRHPNDPTALLESLADEAFGPSVLDRAEAFARSADPRPSAAGPGSDCHAWRPAPAVPLALVPLADFASARLPSAGAGSPPALRAVESLVLGQGPESAEKYIETLSVQGSEATAFIRAARIDGGIRALDGHAAACSAHLPPEERTRLADPGRRGAEAFLREHPAGGFLLPGLSSCGALPEDPATALLTGLPLLLRDPGAATSAASEHARACLAALGASDPPVPETTLSDCARLARMAEGAGLPGADALVRTADALLAGRGLDLPPPLFEDPTFDRIMEAIDDPAVRAATGLDRNCQAAVRLSGARARWQSLVEMASIETAAAPAGARTRPCPRI